jgi:hypothetical protein
MLMTQIEANFKYIQFYNQDSDALIDNIPETEFYDDLLKKGVADLCQ